MASPKIWFEWHNCNAHRLTNYQSLVFHFIVGKLAIEDETMFKDGTILIETYLEKEHENTIYIRCHGVHPHLMADILRSFPKQLNVALDIVGGEGFDYVGAQVLAFDLAVNPITTREISFTIKK